MSEETPPETRALAEKIEGWLREDVLPFTASTRKRLGELIASRFQPLDTEEVRFALADYLHRFFGIEASSDYHEEWLLRALGSVYVVAEDE